MAGLFNNPFRAERFGVDPETQQAIDAYAAMPMQQEQPRRGGLFGGGFGQVLQALAGGALDGVATHYGATPGYAMEQERQRGLLERIQQAQASEALRQKTRMEGREDKQWEWQNKPRDAGSPYRTEDNSGNVWEIGPDGQSKRIFTDETPRYYMQGDRAIEIPNPFSGQGGGVSPPMAGVVTPPQAGGSNFITKPEADMMRNSLGAGYDAWRQKNGVRVIVRTGTAPDGRRVMQFDDGTTDYAD